MSEDEEKSLDVLAGDIDKLTRLHPNEMGRVNAWIRAVMFECDKLADEVQRNTRAAHPAVEVCHICKRPRSEPGEMFCSAAHGRHPAVEVLDELEAALLSESPPSYFGWHDALKKLRELRKAKGV